MALTTIAAEVYRDYDLDGVPASGAHNPKKLDIRRLLSGYENVINAFTSAGGLIYDTRALLESDLAKTANSMAWVISDASAANNGVYKKVGASGTGSWARVADLPYSLIVAEDSGAGTANAIQATSSLPVSGSALILLNIYETNGPGPTTVQFNGGTVYTVKTNGGNDVAPGGLQSGMLVMGRVSGATFRLVSDQASAALLAQMEELFGDFQQHYAGSFPDNTAADAALGTPTEGAIYWNSTENNLLVYDGATWQPIETVLLSSLAQAEAGTDNLTAITPLRLTQKLKHDGFLSFGQSGVVFDSSSDQSTAVLSFLEGIAGDGGGRALMPPGRRITLGGVVLRLPDSTGITGNDYQHGSLNAADALQEACGLLLDGATLRLGNGCDVTGVSLINPTLDLTRRQTAADVSTLFDGVAVEFAVSTSDQSVFDCLIAGFDTGIQREQNGVVGVTRGKVGRCLIDCKNGVNLEYDYDVPRLVDVHCYPISSYGDDVLANSPQDLLRPGTAFRVGNVSDWGGGRSCFTFGYFIGFDADGADHFTWWDCGADYPAVLGHDNSIAFRWRNECLAPAMIHCKGAARQIGVQYFPTGNALNHPLRIKGGTFWANSDAIVIVDGIAIIDGVLVHDGRSLANDGVTPITSRGVLGDSGADDVLVINSTFVNVAQPIIGASSAVPIRQRDNRFPAGNAGVFNTYVSTIASASTLPVNGKDNYFLVTGTTAINILDNVAAYAGKTVTLEFQSALTIVHSATMRCAGATNLVVSANDVVSFTSTGTAWVQSTPLVAI